MPTIDADVFFDHYRDALLDRDPARIATCYAVPGLILFPGSSIPVTSEAQTEEFFAAALVQYGGVTEVDLDLVVLARSSHSVWADVTWVYDGSPRERFCYQLVAPEDPKIAVLTPLELS